MYFPAAIEGSSLDGTLIGIYLRNGAKAMDGPGLLIIAASAFGHKDCVHAMDSIIAS